MGELETKTVREVQHFACFPAWASQSSYIDHIYHYIFIRHMVVFSTNTASATHQIDGSLRACMCILIFLMQLSLASSETSRLSQCVWLTALCLPAELMMEDPTDAVNSYEAGIFARLEGVKAAYDPNNLFRDLRYVHPNAQVPKELVPEGVYEALPLPADYAPPAPAPGALPGAEPVPGAVSAPGTAMNGTVAPRGQPILG